MADYESNWFVLLPYGEQHFLLFAKKPIWLERKNAIYCYKLMLTT